MREILFRGKRTDNGEWIMGYYFFEGGKVFADFYGCHYIHPCNKNQAFSVIPESVGQYTGQSDKNGNKKIFEGDIVWGDDCAGTWHKGIVEYDENLGSFIINAEQYFTQNPKNDNCYDLSGSWTVEGNIHDNPELLKKEE